MIINTHEESGKPYLQPSYALVIDPERRLLTDWREWAALGESRLWQVWNINTSRPCVCCFRLEFHLHWLWPYENIVSGLGEKWSKAKHDASIKSCNTDSWPRLNLRNVSSNSNLKTSGGHLLKGMPCWTNDTGMSTEFPVSSIGKAFIPLYQLNRDILTFQKSFAAGLHGCKLIQACWKEDKQQSVSDTVNFSGFHTFFALVVSRRCSYPLPPSTPLSTPTHHPSPCNALSVVPHNTSFFLVLKPWF